MDIVILSVSCAFFLAAAILDLHTRSIPNIVPLALMALFILATQFAPLAISGPPGAHVLLATALGIAGFLSFSVFGLGGGDGKLMAVVGLWAGPADIGLCLLGMALVGLGLAGIACLPSAVAREWRNALPYSIAIAMPTVFVLGHRAWLLA